MDLTSSRLKAARKDAKLTFRELSDYTGITEKSLMRYENGQSTPDSRNIKELAAVYSISVDYLLGISNNAQSDMTEEYNLKWYQYQRTNKNRIQDNTVYYWLIYDAKTDGIPTKGAMEWCESKYNKELYHLRPVKPKECINLITDFYNSKPIIINHYVDWCVFIIYGGHAIVCEDICHQCVPYLMRPGTVKA